MKSSPLPAALAPQTDASPWMSAVDVRVYARNKSIRAARVWALRRHVRYIHDGTRRLLFFRADVEQTVRTGRPLDHTQRPLEAPAPPRQQALRHEHIAHQSSKFSLVHRRGR